MLSDSDRVILEHIRDGRVDAEIAVRLGMENRQLKARIESLMERLAVTTRPELRDRLAIPGAIDALRSTDTSDTPEDSLPRVESAANVPPDAAAGPVTTQREPARMPVLGVASGALAILVAALALGWVAVRDRSEPAAAEPVASPTAALMVLSTPVALPDTTTILGLTAKEASFAGSVPLPAGVEITVLRGTAIDRGLRIERVRIVNGVQEVEPVYAAPEGTRITGALADSSGETIAIGVCRGCAGARAGGNGATVDYLVSRGHGAEFVTEYQVFLSAGEPVSHVAAILPASLILYRTETPPSVYMATSGSACDGTPLAVAGWTQFLWSAPAQPQLSCPGGFVIGENVIFGAEVTGVRPLDSAANTSIADWRSFSRRGTTTYFTGRIDARDPEKSIALRIPDVAVTMGQLADGRLIGHMRTDPESAVLMPVVIDLATATYAYLDGALYTAPPQSRLIEVPMYDRPPETIQVIAVTPE